MKLQALVFAIAMLAAAGAGGLLAGPLGVAFGASALLAIGGALICLLGPGVRGAGGWLASCVGTAGLCLLLGSDFIAVGLVAIGGAGSGALLLFGALLAPPDPRERDLLRIGAAFCALAPLAAFLAWRFAAAAAVANETIGAPAPRSAERIGVALLDPTRFAVALEALGVILAVALVAGARCARAGEPEEAK